MPKIQKREPKNKYEEYCWKNATEFLKLVIDFLSNENEGERYYQPTVLSTRLGPDGKPRIKLANNKSGTQLIDFVYVSNIIRLFFRLGDDTRSYFEYKNGYLNYVVNHFQRVNRDIDGNEKYVNGHLDGIKGKKIFRYGKTKSPIGRYKRHGSDGTTEYGYRWNRYFDPEYTVSGTGEVGRSTDYRYGEYPQNWFPKKDEESSLDILVLAKMIVKTFCDIKDEKAKALFIAFLKGSKRGEIDGLKILRRGDIGSITNYCEKRIDSELGLNKQSYYPKLKPQYNNTTDEIHYFDSNGTPSDSDMEHISDRIKVENIIRNTIMKYLNENVF